MKVRNNKNKLRIKNLTSYKIDFSNFEINECIENWIIIFDKRTNKEGWMSEDYTKLINPIFDECYSFKENFGVFKKNNKYGWVDTFGNIIGEGFDFCSSFSEGFGVFKKGNKYGFMNKNGIIIKEELDNCYFFQEGFAIFMKDGKEGWIDSEGNIIGDGFDVCYDFYEGFGKFVKDGKCGWIDKNGKIVKLFKIKQFLKDIFDVSCNLFKYILNKS